MTAGFLIERRPPAGRELPVLVTIPHFGTDPLPGPAAPGFSRERYSTLPAGFADAFAADLYGGLHDAGATVLASPYSRLFVDLNRRRDDFETRGAAVVSRRGVVRTHMVDDEAIFSAPLTEPEVERRLARFYDPFHRRLRDIVQRLRERHGRVVVIDGHTAIGRRIGNHQVVVGTQRGETCGPALSSLCERVFAERRFTVHHDVPGYRGGHVVRSVARMDGAEGVQIEVNASLLMTVSRREFIDRQVRGERPPCDGQVLARLHAALDELVPAAAALGLSCAAGSAAEDG